MSSCVIRGCNDQVMLGTRLCSTHLDQTQTAYREARDMAGAASRSVENADPYDAVVANFTARIANSEQMRNLAAALVEGGVRDAVDSFPDLSVVPANALEQLVSFLAVNVVSAIIQERAHLLARAFMLKDALPKAEAEGIRQMIEMEMGFVEVKGETEGETENVT